MAKAAPSDPYAGIAAASEIATDWAPVDVADDDLPDAAALRQMALTAEAHALAVKGREQIGRCGRFLSPTATMRLPPPMALPAATGAPASRSAPRQSPAKAPAWSAITTILSVTHPEDLRKRRGHRPRGGRARGAPRRVRAKSSRRLFPSSMTAVSRQVLSAIFLAPSWDRRSRAGTSFLRDRLGPRFSPDDSKSSTIPPSPRPRLASLRCRRHRQPGRFRSSKGRAHRLDPRSASARQLGLEADRACGARACRPAQPLFDPMSI